MKEMHISKKQLIFTAYNIDQPAEDFSVQAETTVFANRRWFNIYVKHIPSDRIASVSIVPYRDSDVEKAVSELIYQALPRDDSAYFDRLDRFFSEEVIEPTE